MTQSTGVGRGGARANSGGPRAGAGRPRGSTNTTYRPHIEKALAAEAGGLTPKEVLIAVMRWHFQAERFDEAARVAAMVAPFIHPRLSSTAVNVKPTLWELFKEASSEELQAFLDEAEREVESAPEGRDALAKTRGNA